MIKQVLRKSLHTVKEHIDKSNFQKKLNIFTCHIPILICALHYNRYTRSFI
ncbi:hypothetical protein Sauau03_00076 [Staphylococcus aureus]